MRIKLTLERSGGSPVDVEVTTDATCTVGALADRLAAVDPGRRSTPASGPLTVALISDAPRHLDPRTALADSPLRSGARISLLPASQAYRPGERDAVATATVVDGPDRGREYPLGSGANVVGRLAGCEVLLDDPLVSRQHARINVTSEVEVIDLGSANGLEINDVQTTRASLRASDRVRLGDTVLSIRLLHAPETAGRIDSGSVGFIRQPVVPPYCEGLSFEAPDVPERQRRAPFPWVMLFAPLLMAGVLYWTTKNPASLLLAGLSPLMLAGSAIEQRRQAGRLGKQSLASYRDDLEGLRSQVEAAHVDEVAVRLLEHPAAVEAAQAARARGALLWSRRPGELGHLELRLGLGSAASRTTVKPPELKRAPRELASETLAVLLPLAVVHGVPVVARLEKDGAVGVAGARSAALAHMRALLLQEATLHTPGVLSIAVLASTRTAADWDWVKWLPHVGSVYSPFARFPLASSPASCAALLSELETLVGERTEAADAAQAARPAHSITVLVEGDCPADFARLSELAEHGWRRGVHVLWLAPDLDQLPAACRTFTVVESLTTGSVGYVGQREVTTPVELDTVSAEVALAVARSLSPVTDLGALAEDATDLPRSVPFLAMAGHEQLADGPEPVVERWLQSQSLLTGPMAPAEPARRAGSLRAAIGMRGAELLTVDLRADGPHALVGGTTGSGKSELLQTWILSMAASHSPQRLTFLLIDYKGGSAFAECAELPHTVGLVTDLDPHGVRRALDSLRAELTYRERLLRERGKAKDLITLERSGDPQAPPSLVIVVDEFAALVQEVPEFVEGVVNVAQRGRSLGLHLVLATQRPAGVIKDNLRANTNLRVALRVADESDSTDVLGTPDAAFFDQDVPGRAMSKSGAGRLVPFQTAYVGGRSGQGPVQPDIAVAELKVDPGVVWELPQTEQLNDEQSGPTDLVKVVARITQAHRLAVLPTPRKPWLPALADHVHLRADLPMSGSDRRLIFGLLDDPGAQEQRPVAYDPELGNLAVYGASGSGKSTFLRTIAVAAGLTFGEAPCHVYALDFAARGLTLLEKLPHVGAVIAGSEDERVRRLVDWLDVVVEERATRYAQVEASSLGEYREGAGEPHEPRMLLMIDGIGAFYSAYENDASGGTWAGLVRVATSGRAYGVHVIATTDRGSGIPFQLAATVQQSLVLRMPDAEEYRSLDVPPDLLSSSSPAGRGVWDRREVQVAVLGGSDLASQAEEVSHLSKHLGQIAGPQAVPVHALAQVVRLGQLPASVGGQAAIGLSAETLGPVAISPAGTFLVAGPPGSGRAEAAEAVVLAALRVRPRLRRYLVTAHRRSALARTEGWTEVAVGVDEAIDLALRLDGELTQLVTEGVDVEVTLVVEDVAEWDMSPAEQSLTDLVKLLVRGNGLVVSEGEIGQYRRHGLLAQLNASRVGVLLQPEAGDGQDQLGARLPFRTRRSDFPPGRGYLVRSGRHELVQIAIP